MLLEQLDRMDRPWRMIKADRDHWALPQAATRHNLLAGRLDVHRDGFRIRPPGNAPGRRRRRHLHSSQRDECAMQGDQVLVELAPPRPDGRHSGRIVRILSRRNPTVVGIFHYALQEHAPGNTVTPLDERITQPILIPFGLEQAPALPSGTPHRVVSENIGAQRRSVTSDPGRNGRGRGNHRLAYPNAVRPGSVIEILAVKTISVWTSKSSSASIISPCFFRPMFSMRRAPSRTWIRWKLPAAVTFATCPSSPSTAKPPRTSMDAVFVRQHGGADGTWELQVHIADVAQYVTPGSALDLEARCAAHRSIFPIAQSPMLPRNFRATSASLRPGENRLVLSCLMLIDPDGEVRSL